MYTLKKAFFSFLSCHISNLYRSVGIDLLFSNVPFSTEKILKIKTKFLISRLLHVRNANCKYVEAEMTWHEAQALVYRLKDAGHTVNAATLYSECCTLHFAKSQYDLVRNTGFILSKCLGE